MPHARGSGRIDYEDEHYHEVIVSPKNQQSTILDGLYESSPEEAADKAPVDIVEPTINVHDYLSQGNHVLPILRNLLH